MIRAGDRPGLALVGPALLLIASAASAQAPARLARADSGRLARVAALFAAHDRPDRPGYAVGIVQDGRVVFARGFGSANLDTREPITSASVFNAASLAKQVTAASIGLLILRGQVSLEDEVRRHIREFPDYPGPIRVKHLVYLTSGLPEYYTVERPGGLTWDRDFFTVTDAIQAVLQQPSLEFAPGTRWGYSNINYMLLAEIVRRVSGVSFAEFARRELFAPLGMRRTLIHDDLGIAVPGRATGYNLRDDGRYRAEIRHAPHFGGSGLFTTVDDLIIWDRNFSTHVVGGPKLTELLLRTMRFDHDKANDAFGLVWGTYRGMRTVWYEGGDLGFSSYMVRLLDHRFSVIVLSNLGTGNAAQQARRILDLFVE